MSEPRDLKPSPDPAGSIPYLPTDLPPGVTVAWLCEVLWDAEARFGLLDWEVAGVKPWMARRFAIFQWLATELTLIDEGPEEPPRAWPERLRYHARLLRGAVSKSPFRDTEKCDVLVFEGPRSGIVDGDRVCVHTHSLVSDLTQQGKRVRLLDSHLDGFHIKSPDPRRRFIDSIAIESGARFRLSRWTPTDSDLRFLTTLEKHLTSALSIPVGLGWLLTPGVPRFKASYIPYRRLLQKLQPTEIFVVCAYSVLAPLVAAAKNLGIRVTEVQHSVTSRYHMGYGYPGASARSIDYLPDRFLAWTRVGRYLADLPCQVEAIAPPWTRSGLSPGTVKEERLMVVLSQPVIARRLAKALLDRSQQLLPYRLVVKPHPAELADPRLRQVFEPLRELRNVTITESSDLRKLLSRAEYQVGVYSTALYEGIHLGCRTLLIPLPGIEHMSHLLPSGEATLLDDFLVSEQLTT